MKILIDFWHPAHFHLFKNFINFLINDKHDVTIVTRHKDVINKLLDNYGLSYTSLTNPKKGFWGSLTELAVRDIKLFKLYMKSKFDVAFGTSVSITHLSFFTKMRSYNFNEDDDKVVPLFVLAGYPFATKIINPTCIKYEKFEGKRIFHSSYHELAYLHPNNFKPDISILKKYNLKPYTFIIVRKSALLAHHDKWIKGLEGTVWQDILENIKKYPLVMSIENSKTHDIDPWDMHHVMAFAKLIVSDSQTMTAEAAVLGVPSIRYNSFVGRISYLEELEHKYKLTFGFLPGNSENGKELIEKLKDLLNLISLHEEWQKRCSYMLSEKIDLASWMIEYFNKEIKTN